MQIEFTVIANKNAFVTLKDHKENFASYPKCGLINPAETELGIICKKYLENISKQITESIKLNQWRNTHSVIAWFKSIPNKNQTKFLKFDIVDFYPSISQKLIQNVIKFAKLHTKIDKQISEVILKARKSVLFNKNEPWIKKAQTKNFDVTMRSYDGAEVYELVGMFLLHELNKLFGKNNVGLYRNDGLANVTNASGPQMDKLRKKIVTMFKNYDLKITTETNLSPTDYLVVFFDLSKNTYSPFRKLGNESLYINSKSNHPPSIIKQLPSMINKRLNDLSCNKEEFDKATPMCKKALLSSGHDNKLKFDQNKNLPKRTRKRKTIWFNPPYSMSVQTNIGKIFFKLIDQHFPKNHKYHKIFNRSTLKMSYSCISNMTNFKPENPTILNRFRSRKMQLPTKRRMPFKRKMPNHRNRLSGNSSI